jgi:hypothetical protein
MLLVLHRPFLLGVVKAPLPVIDNRTDRTDQIALNEPQRHPEANHHE